MKTSRELAAEIYLVTYHKRAELLEQIPYPQRADVEQYMENMAKKAQLTANRKKGRAWDKKV